MTYFDIRSTASDVPYRQVDQGLIDPMTVIPTSPGGTGWQFDYTAMWGKPYGRVGGWNGQWLLGWVRQRPVG